MDEEIVQIAAARKKRTVILSIIVLGTAIALFVALPRLLDATSSESMLINPRLAIANGLHVDVRVTIDGRDLPMEKQSGTAVMIDPPRPIALEAYVGKRKVAEAKLDFSDRKNRMWNILGAAAIQYQKIQYTSDDYVPSPYLPKPTDDPPLCGEETGLLYADVLFEEEPKMVFERGDSTTLTKLAFMSSDAWACVTWLEANGRGDEAAGLRKRIDDALATSD